jgi:hypothetical protein
MRWQMTVAAPKLAEISVQRNFLVTVHFAIEHALSAQKVGQMSVRREFVSVFGRKPILQATTVASEIAFRSGVFPTG